MGTSLARHPRKQVTYPAVLWNPIGVGDVGEPPQNGQGVLRKLRVTSPTSIPWSDRKEEAAKGLLDCVAIGPLNSPYKETTLPKGDAESSTNRNHGPTPKGLYIQGGLNSVCIVLGCRGAGSGADCVLGLHLSFLCCLGPVVAS